MVEHQPECFSYDRGQVTALDVRGPELLVRVPLTQAVEYLRRHGPAHTESRGDSSAHMEAVVHDVDGVVLLCQVRPKGAQQGPQRPQQGCPCISFNELLQRCDALPRAIPTASQAGRAHRQPQHEHSNLAAAAGPPESLMDSINGLLQVFLEPGWIMRLLAHPLRQPLADAFPVCCGPFSQPAKDLVAEQLIATLFAQMMAIIKCHQQPAAALNAGWAAKAVVEPILFVELYWGGRRLFPDIVSQSRKGFCEMPDTVTHVFCPYSCWLQAA